MSADALTFPRPCRPVETSEAGRREPKERTGPKRSHTGSTVRCIGSGCSMTTQLLWSSIRLPPMPSPPSSPWVLICVSHRTPCRQTPGPLPPARRQWPTQDILGREEERGRSAEGMGPGRPLTLCRQCLLRSLNQGGLLVMWGPLI